MSALCDQKPLENVPNLEIFARRWTMPILCDVKNAHFIADLPVAASGTLQNV